MATTQVKHFELAGTKGKGTIAVAHVSEPYGPKSHSVVSIGISLKGDIENPEWKSHIPYENLDELIEALQLAKKTHA